MKSFLSSQLLILERVVMPPFAVPESSGFPPANQRALSIAGASPRSSFETAFYVSQSLRGISCSLRLIAGLQEDPLQLPEEDICRTVYLFHLFGSIHLNSMSNCYSVSSLSPCTFLLQ